MTGAGITSKCYPAHPSPGGKKKSVIRNDRTRQEQKRGFPPFVEVGIKTNRKKSSSPGKAAITLQSAIHLTKSYKDTVLIGESQLAERGRLEWGSSDAADIFI